MYRTCNKCGRVKRINEFSRNKRMKSGYHPICLKCNSMYWRNSIEPIGFELSNHPDKQKMIDECWNDPIIKRNLEILKENDKNITKDSKDFLKMVYNYHYNKGVDFKVLLGIFNPVF